MAQGDRYVYDPAHGAGLGEHHAGQLLADRPAQPGQVADAMRGTLAMIEPSKAQQAKLDAFLGRTMADLDMTAGTQVVRLAQSDHPDAAHRAEEEQATGLVVLGWTDRHGDERVTSVTPEYFAEHFAAVQA
jgi:hypothetical protein